MTLATETRTFGKFSVDEVTSAPLRVHRSTTIPTDRATLFDFLIQYEQMNTYFPIVESVSYDSSNADVDRGNGTERVCNFTDGSSCKELIYGFQEPETFAYAITGENPFGVDGHIAVVNLTDNGDGTTELNWYQYFNHPDIDAMSGMINQVFDGTFANLLEKYS